MVAMWHESLNQSETKSRQTPNEVCKPGMILFMYLWPFIANDQWNRNIGTTDGVAQEYDEYFHRNNLNIYMWKYFYDKVCECPDCKEE